MPDLRFAWLEITGKCQLRCVHCYADSGPSGSHGAMTPDDWVRAIDEAAELGARTVQFIGGEPTVHPELPAFLIRALARDLEVEVFTNLFRITDRLWQLFSRPKVRLATSYYSDDADQHDAITTRRGSRDRTKANIEEALRRSIPLRVGIIGMGDDQRAAQATAELRALGVRDIGVDHLRQVGRGVRDREPSTEQLCGNCGDGAVAIGPDGTVWPCVFARWMPVGNVLRDRLADIVGGSDMAATAKLVRRRSVCVPKMCNPQCGPSCSPACRPANNCTPVGRCVPTEY